jgi:hypothetical protein
LNLTSLCACKNDFSSLLKDASSAITHVRPINLPTANVHAPLINSYDQHIYTILTHTPLLIITGGDSQSSNKRSLYERNGVAVCSQKKALIIASSVFACLLAFSILIAFISQTGEESTKSQITSAFFYKFGLPQIVLVWDKATTRMILTSLKTACPGSQRRPTESHTLGTAFDCRISCDPYATTSPYIPISPLTS